VRVESTGFKVYLARGVRLVNQQVLRLDVPLELGSVDTTIEVQGGAEQIETESARIGDVKGAELFSVRVTVTVAPGTTPPFGSVTIPVILANVVCAKTFA
jgi:hypothetical protein